MLFIAVGRGILFVIIVVERFDCGDDESDVDAQENALLLGFKGFEATITFGKTACVCF